MRGLVLLVCGALIGCGGLYGAERAKGGKVSCDRAGFEAGTPEHRECMLRYIEAFMNRAGVHGDDLRHHRQRHDMPVEMAMTANDNIVLSPWRFISKWAAR